MVEHEWTSAGYCRNCEAPIEHADRACAERAPVQSLQDTLRGLLRLAPALERLR